MMNWQSLTLSLQGRLKVKKIESEGLKVDHKSNDFERSFTKRCNLNRHMQDFHNIESRFDINKLIVLSYPFKCDQCDKKSKRKDHLKLHKDQKHCFVKWKMQESVYSQVKSCHTPT